jgi:hypothetical protein
MNKDSLINFKNMIDNYEIKYKTSLDKDVDLQNILNKSKYIAETLLNIYDRDLILLQKIDDLLKNNESFNDRDSLIKVQNDIMDEFKQLTKTISHISGLSEIVEEIPNNVNYESKPVITPDTNTTKTNIQIENNQQNLTSPENKKTDPSKSPSSDESPNKSPSDISSAESESSSTNSLLENIKNLFSNNLYLYKDDSNKSGSSNVVNTILSSKQNNENNENKSSKSKGKSPKTDKKKKIPGKITDKSPTNKSNYHKKQKTVKKITNKKKSSDDNKSSADNKQIILPNYNLDDKENPSIKKKHDNSSTTKKCDYELEMIDNNFPKIKQFRKKTRKKNKKTNKT